MAHRNHMPVGLKRVFSFGLPVVSLIVDMQTRLSGVVSNVRGVAEQIGRIAQETAAASHEFSAGTRAQPRPATWRPPDAEWYVRWSRP